MDSLEIQPSDKLKYFKKDDFETDWIKVANGEFCQVFKVKVKLWRATLAMKCFSDTFSDTSFYRNMMKEVSKMEKIKFTYIVSIYGFCNDPPAIVMEYMSNGSLDNLLTSHVLMWPKKFQMIHEVSMGMNFLHSMQPPLLHLNLKPANILLDDHLHIKISDFDFVKWEESSNMMEFIEQSTGRGNINYIPPEMFTEKSKLPGTKYDVYSFAIVMWEILTQKKPYPGANMMAVIMKVTSGKRPCLEMIPEQRPVECDQMMALMQRCWSPDARQRPGFLDIVRETEILGEILRIPDLSRGCDKKTKSNQLTFSKVDFTTFKESLNKQHVYMRFEKGNSILHYAVATGDVDTVKHVLNFGAAVDSYSGNGYTPLIIAVLYKFLDICSLLIAHEADVNLSDEDGWTPLHFAAQNAEDRIARLLLDNSAKVNASEKDGWTPLHLASQNDHENMVRILLSRQAAIEQQEKEGRTALHIASVYGHVNIVKLLIGHGADANKTENGQCTPLHMAAKDGHFRVVRLLIKSGADVHSLDNNQFTALHLAALKGHNGICRQLLGQRADPDLKTSQQWTALHLAALKGHQATVLLLEENHAVVNSRGKNGQTPLHLACRYGQEEVVSALLTVGVDPNIAEDSGWTPLHMACQCGSFPSVLQLIAHRADVNAQHKCDWTPLHFAAYNGNVPIVKALLMNGAEQDARDASGFTPLHLALSNNKQEVAQLLSCQDT
ncbi:ANKK1 protein, partial [Amia calva]|nr:ANKK1 protein [Amia calva]